MTVTVNTERRKLEREARVAAEWRGHLLHGFVVEDSRRRSSAFCRRCGRGVYVDVKPPPNGIEIHGEAVALNCPPR